MKTKNSGFTLIEVMVAIGVIAIAIPALLFSMMAEIDGAGYMRDKLEAQWVADNLIEEVRIQNRLSGKVPDSDKSGDEEMAGRKWFWKSRSKPFPQKELSDIYGVEVSVWLADNKTDDPLVKVVGIIQQHKNEPIQRPAGEGGITSNPNAGSNAGSTTP